MVALAPALGALLALQTQAPSPDLAAHREDPARVLWLATRAVEGDSAAVLESAWRARLRRDPADRPALLGLATLARLSYDYARAARHYARLLAPPGAVPDRYAVHARLGQALAFRVRWRTDQADHWLQLAHREARLAGDSGVATEALLELAMMRARTVGVTAADSLFTRADAIAPRSDQRTRVLLHCVRARVLTVIASPETEPIALAGARLARAAGEPRLEAACLHALAGDLRRRGMLDSALVVWARVEALQRGARDRAGLAATLQWRGSAWANDGFYGNALVDLHEAVREGTASGNLSPVAWAWLNLTWIAVVTGDLAWARDYALRADRLLTSQNDQWGLANLRSYQGDLAVALGDFAGAGEAYRDALAGWARFGGAPASVITTHTQLARLAIFAGDWPTAEAELMAARRVARQFGLPTWETGLATTVGVLELRRGNLAAAEREFRRGLESDQPEQRLFRYRNRARLAEVYARRGEPARAERELAAAFDEVDAWRSTVSHRELRLRSFEFEEDRLDPDLGVATAIAVLARSGREAAAFQLAERRRARELLDALARGAAVLPSPVGRSGSAEPSRPGTRSSHPAVTAAEVRRVLPDSTALLCYVTGKGEEVTTLFVLTRDTLRATILPPMDRLVATVWYLVSLLESRDSAASPARRLGDALLRPALQVLPPGVRRLIIVPDDILNRVAFDVLFLPDGRRVIERFTVTVAPSAGVLVELRRRPPRADEPRLLAFGDPAFPEAAPNPGDSVLPRLPFSRREARAAARTAESATLRLGRDASEAYLRRAPLADYRVIHFATHAVVDERSEVRTRLALSAGLGEDGFLGPGDLALLRLDADLVVLSSCRTAGGVVVRGEGVQGLVAPLIGAGARSVVATQWRVADRAAAGFVAIFYRYLVGGLTVGDALREAKLEAMRRGAPIGEWAAFTAVGDPLARPFARDGAAATH
jgi:tetratricopeptide (TPR) repeat protein